MGDWPRGCYQTVRDKLAGGEVREVNELITYNLDIRQFAQDVIEACEGPELLRAMWKAIREVTVLDPTCGSGAFLFAALNILEPLYEGCLQRMEVSIEEAEDGRGDPGDRPGPRRYADFRHVLEDVARHPNRRYCVLKSIIVNNLYGVDIMEEAVEICKLRLFLKLGPRWRARSTSSREALRRRGTASGGFALREREIARMFRIAIPTLVQ